jgi:hypothetical protein
MGSEEKEEGMQPSFVMFDDGKKAFWAIGVAAKEVSEPIVEWVKGVLDQSGYEGEKDNCQDRSRAEHRGLEEGSVGSTHGGDCPD